MFTVRRAITIRPRVAIQARSVGSSVHQSDPNVLAAEKARNLKGEQKSSASLPKHAPGWNEKLASDSEAAVKADQAVEGKPSKELQQQTIEKVHEHHHSDAGKKGAEAQHAAKEGARPTGSEDAVKADRGEH